MNRRPIIGIIGYQTQPNPGIGLRQTYIDSVLRAGGLPIVLPLITEEETVTQTLKRIDGLILSGGGDADPATFGEERRPECGDPDRLRDTSELQYIRLARVQKMPIFGICRGVQMLNIAYGGTLIQDIEAQCDIPRNIHRQEEPYNHLTHEVTLVKGGLLQQITGMTRIMTNTIHHQAVKTLGDSLVIEASTIDGIIEAISDRSNDAIFGVQFHPEFLSDECEYAQKMFDYFVKKAMEYTALRAE